MWLISTLFSKVQDLPDSTVSVPVSVTRSPTFGAPRLATCFLRAALNLTLALAGFGIANVGSRTPSLKRLIVTFVALL